MLANEMVVDYEVKLAEAKEEAEKAKREAEKARDEAERAKSQLEGARTFNARMDKQRREEAEKERDEIIRLKAQMGRLQDRLRYLQAVEEPSGLAAQVRGTIEVVEVLKEKKVDVPQHMIDILSEDLAEYEAQVEAIPRVELDPEDLEPINQTTTVD